MPGGKNSNTTLLLDAAQKVETKETKIESKEDPARQKLEDEYITRLQKSDEITSIELEHGWSPEGLNKLFKLLQEKKPKELKLIRLNGVVLSDENFKILCDLLKTNYKLQIIRICDAHLNDAQGVMLVSALNENLKTQAHKKQNCKLKSLNLSNNFIGDDTATALATFLKDPAAVEFNSPFLKNTAITSKGFAVLADALRELFQCKLKKEKALNIHIGKSKNDLFGYSDPKLQSFPSLPEQSAILFLNLMCSVEKGYLDLGDIHSDSPAAYQNTMMKFEEKFKTKSNEVVVNADGQNLLQYKSQIPWLDFEHDFRQDSEQAKIKLGTLLKQFRALDLVSFCTPFQNTFFSRLLYFRNLTTFKVLLSSAKPDLLRINVSFALKNHNIDAANLILKELKRRSEKLTEEYIGYALRAVLDGYYVDGLKLVLELNPNLKNQSKDKYAVTPLIEAVKCFFPQGVKLLLEAIVKNDPALETLKIKDNAGYTAEDWAVKMGLDEVRELFREVRRKQKASVTMKQPEIVNPVEHKAPKNTAASNLGKKESKTAHKPIKAPKNTPKANTDVAKLVNAIKEIKKAADLKETDSALLDCITSAQELVNNGLDTFTNNISVLTSDETFKKNFKSLLATKEPARWFQEITKVDALFKFFLPEAFDLLKTNSHPKIKGWIKAKLNSAKIKSNETLSLENILTIFLSVAALNQFKSAEAALTENQLFVQLKNAVSAVLENQKTSLFGGLLGVAITETRASEIFTNILDLGLNLVNDSAYKAKLLAIKEAGYYSKKYSVLESKVETALPKTDQPAVIEPTVTPTAPSKTDESKNIAEAKIIKIDFNPENELPAEIETQTPTPTPTELTSPVTQQQESLPVQASTLQETTPEVLPIVSQVPMQNTVEQTQLPQQIVLQQVVMPRLGYYFNPMLKQLSPLIIDSLQAFQNQSGQFYYHPQMNVCFALGQDGIFYPMVLTPMQQPVQTPQQEPVITYVDQSNGNKITCRVSELERCMHKLEKANYYYHRFYHTFIYLRHNSASKSDEYVVASDQIQSNYDIPSQRKPQAGVPGKVEEKHSAMSGSAQVFSSPVSGIMPNVSSRAIAVNSNNGNLVAVHAGKIPVAATAPPVMKR